MNPWLLVPAQDYEAHMTSPAVGQLPVLGRVLRADLERVRPRALAVLGCATGNGFEHIDPAVTSRVVGLDINPSYLELVRQRHGARLPGLELIEGDVLEADIPAAAFDLVHAALLLEYVNPWRAVQRMAGWLRPGGALTIVLQEPSASTAAVTPTPYHSLKGLGPLFRFLDAQGLEALAAAAGLSRERLDRIPLPGGKSFLVAMYAKTPTEEK